MLVRQKRILGYLWNTLIPFRMIQEDGTAVIVLSAASVVLFMLKELLWKAIIEANVLKLQCWKL